MREVDVVEPRDRVNEVSRGGRGIEPGGDLDVEFSEVWVMEVVELVFFR